MEASHKINVYKPKTLLCIIICALALLVLGSIKVYDRFIAMPRCSDYKYWEEAQLDYLQKGIIEGNRNYQQLNGNPKEDIDACESLPKLKQSNLWIQ